MTERPSPITAVLKRSRCRVTSMPLAHHGAPHARRPPIRDHVKKVTGPDARLERHVFRATHAVCPEAKSQSRWCFEKNGPFKRHIETAHPYLPSHA